MKNVNNAFLSKIKNEKKRFISMTCIVILGYPSALCHYRRNEAAGYDCDTQQTGLLQLSACRATVTPTTCIQRVQNATAGYVFDDKISLALVELHLLLSYQIQTCPVEEHATHWPVSLIHQRRRDANRPEFVLSSPCVPLIEQLIMSSYEPTYLRCMKRETTLRRPTTQHSLIACSSDMFDIRSNIVRQYDQIFQTYLTISDDHRFTRLTQANTPTMLFPRCVRTVIAALMQIGIRERCRMPPRFCTPSLRHVLKRRRIDRSDSI